MVAGSWTFPELSLERLGFHTSSFRTSAKMPSPLEKPWSVPLHWIPCLRRVGLVPGKSNTGAWGCHRGPSSSSKGTVPCGWRSVVRPGLGLCGPVVTGPGVWTPSHLTLFLWDMWLLTGPCDHIQERGERGNAQELSGPPSPLVGRALCQPTVLGRSPVGVTDRSSRETVLESGLWAEKRDFCRNAVRFSL